MKVKIWRALAQILYYYNDSVEVLRPFFENLNNENINDEKFLPLLKTFSEYQLDALCQNGIIKKKTSLFNHYLNRNVEKILAEDKIKKLQAIISGDKIKELQEFIQEKGINLFKTITTSFLEVEKMEIPLIQYCIMNKAIECFKYLLVNGFDDPNKVMEESNPYGIFNYGPLEQYREYEWNSMATAIYFGNKNIIKILEDKGIEKGKNASHIEAAILSYRNLIGEGILEEINDTLKNYLNIGLISSAKSNNIKGAELLISIKGAELLIENVLNPIKKF